MAGRPPAGNSTSTTGPVIWMTRPVAGILAMAIGVCASWLASLAPLGAGRDLDHLARDVGLADLVVGQGQVVDEVLGVVGRILHGDHPRRFLGCLRLEDGLEQPRRHVAWRKRLEDVPRRWLEEELVARD